MHCDPVLGFEALLILYSILYLTTNTKSPCSVDLIHLLHVYFDDRLSPHCFFTTGTYPIINIVKCYCKRQCIYYCYGLSGTSRITFHSRKFKCCHVWLRHLAFDRWKKRHWVKLKILIRCRALHIHHLDALLDEASPDLAWGRISEVLCNFILISPFHSAQMSNCSGTFDFKSFTRLLTSESCRHVRFRQGCMFLVCVTLVSTFCTRDVRPWASSIKKKKVCHPPFYSFHSSEWIPALHLQAGICDFSPAHPAQPPRLFFLEGGVLLSPQNDGFRRRHRSLTRGRLSRLCWAKPDDPVKGTKSFHHVESQSSNYS